jgi:glyoxylase-like metal-dependent hydrolase (beta-lactamase superfamily II)
MIRWDLITVGHLSRNKYWGESDDRGYREPLCTTTLIRTGDRVILVDPGLPPAEMAAALEERAGIAAADVDTVFVTHHHGDHRVGLAACPDARWYIGAAELRAWRPSGAEREIADRIEPAPDELAPGVRLLPTPGHTAGHTSVFFEYGRWRVLVGGDAVMTADFFRHTDYFFNSVDPAEARRTIGRISRTADIVVPGHDNYLLNEWSDRLCAITAHED